MHTVLVDACYLSRSRWSGGIETGVVSKLLDIAEVYQPERIVMVWDTPRSRELRRSILPGYKSTRPPHPDGYWSRVEELRGTLSWWGIDQAEPAEGEADDAIATMAREEWASTGIWSLDKDLLQLVRNGCSVIRPGRGGQPDVVVTPENCRAVTGLDPEGWTAYLTLAGDGTDDVPGLSRVGHKTAMALLRACPEFVGLVLGGQDDRARARVEAADASLTRWVEQAITERQQLAATRELIRLYEVDVKVEPGQWEPDLWERWLQDNGMGWVVRRLAASAGR